MQEVKTCVADVPDFVDTDKICKKFSFSDTLPVVKIYPNYLVQYYEKQHFRMHAKLSDYFYESNLQ